MTGAFPRLDPELRRLRLYRIELIDMHAKHKASGCYFSFLFTQSMHGTEQTIEAYVIFSKEQGGGIVCRVALL
jgi:hypothetical protein